MQWWRLCRRYRVFRDSASHFIAGTYALAWLYRPVRGFSCSLFPVPCSLCTTLCISANSSINQNLTLGTVPLSCFLLFYHGKVTVRTVPDVVTIHLSSRLARIRTGEQCSPYRPVASTARRYDGSRAGVNGNGRIERIRNCYRKELDSHAEQNYAP